MSHICRLILREYLYLLKHLLVDLIRLFASLRTHKGIGEIEVRHLVTWIYLQCLAVLQLRLIVLLLLKEFIATPCQLTHLFLGIAREGKGDQ